MLDILTNDSRQPDRNWLILSCLLLFLGSVFLYSEALEFDFTRYDEHKIIGEHPQLYFDGTILDRIEQIIFLDYPREEPLIVRDLSWLLDSIFFGYNRPFGYHFGNVVYHSFTLVFAFLLVFRLTNFGTALLSGTLLLSLAVHIEPVAWIMGRKDILATLFSLISILLYLKSEDSVSLKSSIFFYGFSATFAFAAYLSKINAVILPGVLLLCALANNQEFMEDRLGPKKAMQIAWKTLIRTLPILILALSVLLWYKSALSQFGLLDKSYKYSSDDLVKLVFTLNPLIFLEYLKIVFLPSNLEAYYTSPSLFRTISTLDKSIAILTIAITVSTIIVLWRCNRTACLLFLCFLLTMLPYANWVHLGFWYANRYIYFGSIFLVAALSSTTLLIFRRTQNNLIKSITIMFFSWFLIQNAIYRTGYMDVWRNGETLWSHEVSLPNPSIRDFNNLTAYYLGQWENSWSEDKSPWLVKAKTANDNAFELELSKDDYFWLPMTYYHQGLILAYSNAQFSLQLESFLRAVESSPGFSLAQRSLGLVYYQMALEAKDPTTRADLATKALFYLNESFLSGSRDTNARKEQKDLLERLKKDFPDLTVKQTNLTL